MPQDREFLKFYALTVNRAFLKLKQLPSLQREADQRAIRELLEELVGDGRRLAAAYRIWKTKTRRLSAEDTGDFVLDLVRELHDRFLGQ